MSGIQENKEIVKICKIINENSSADTNNVNKKYQLGLQLIESTMENQ